MAEDARRTDPPPPDRAGPDGPGPDPVGPGPGGPGETETDPRWRPSPTKVVAGLVLLVGIVVPLLVGSYARVEPRIFGFPFFYAYQLLWVFLAAACCGIAYLLLRAERRRFEARRTAPEPTAEAGR